MKHVSILLLHHVNLAGMENARQALLEANNYLRWQGEPAMFEVGLVALTREVSLSNGLYRAHAEHLVHEVEKTDIVVIPPVRGDMASALHENRDFAPWIIAQYHHGAQVVSLCLGAFILGSTGLLEGRRCVTHWRAAREFSALFPGVHLLTDKLLTDEHGIYTGGGAFSSANLILYLIEKTISRDAAIYCSKMFQVDTGRTSQLPFIIFKGQKAHSDTQVEQAQAYIEENYSDRITVDELCETYGVGRRTFERRFKKATGNTVVEYLQRVKVEAAKRELEKGQMTVNEVMYRVGYSDIKAFREVFKKYCGMSPADYRNRYTQVLV